MSNEENEKLDDQPSSTENPRDVLREDPLAETPPAVDRRSFLTRGAVGGAAAVMMGRSISADELPPQATETSPTDGFVLQAYPGGTPGGNVYLDINFADLIAALNEVEGWKTVYVDDRFGVPTLPEQVFQLPPFTIISALGPKDGGPPRSFLSIPEGCQLLGLRFITGALYLDFQGRVTPLVPASDFVDFPARILIGGYGPKNGPRTQLDANGGAPIFDFPDDSLVQVAYHGQPGVSGNPIYRLGENALMLHRVLPECVLQDNAATGRASSTFSIGLDTGGAVGADPAGAFAGTFLIINRGPGGIHAFGNDSIGAQADRRYLNEGAGPSTAGTSPRRGIFTRPGIVRNITAMHNRSAGNGSDVTYAVEINGVVTAVAVTLATGAVGAAKNVDDFVLISEDDTYALRATKPIDIQDGAVAPVASFEFFAVVEFV